MPSSIELEEPMALLLAEPVWEDEATTGLQSFHECEGENNSNLYSSSDDYFHTLLLGALSKYLVMWVSVISSQLPSCVLIRMMIR
ncbi:unnamed protein product [Linum trigynum]|uniref:Uncharacterized protein n=1 Tax=Linum trigynum TaxID=586398 RepID=A0AAV2D563_9ROSI